MKKRDQTTLRPDFEIGELYLFHPTDPACPATESLWGIFDRREDADVLLESSSADLLRFRLRHRLPEAYRHSRLATRAELRDYAFGLASYEHSRRRSFRTASEER